MDRTSGIKIAFYYKTLREGFDYTRPTSSNQGIGGTEFLIWTTSYFLKKKYPDIEVYLFSKELKDMPSIICTDVAQDEIECIRKCKEYNIDYLVLKGPFIKNEICNAIDEYKVNVILWSHNFENYISVQNIKKCEHIIKNVCVSNEQREWLLDTDIYEKSVTIHNGMCFDDFNQVCVKKQPYRLCYIGNLYPKSGFESVISAWPTIEKKYPQAELYIIGGTNLYNEAVMKKAYSKRSFERLERKVKKAFYGPDGELKSNIHFTGVLGGVEKLEMMASASVGIANITLAGDTFGLGAVEFQALGVPVVSVKRYGVRETILDGQTGVLVKRKSQLADAVCQLFANEEKCEKLADNAKLFVRKAFTIENIVDEWVKLFSNIEGYKNDERIDSYSYDGKQWVKANATLRRGKIGKLFPPILFYKYLGYGCRRVLEKLEII